MSDPKLFAERVASVNPNTDALHIQDSKGNIIAWIDNTGSGQGNLASSSGVPINSPAFTGTPTVPTPDSADNSVTIASTAFVQTAASKVSGFSSFADYPGNPIIAPTGSETLTSYGSVNKVGNTYHAYYMYYISGLGQIGHATSADGKTFTKDSANNPVFTPASGSAWDNLQVGVPTVWIENGTWYMLYRGNSTLGPNQGNYRIGLATSANGISWTRTPHNSAPGTSGNGCVIDLGFQNGGTNSFDPYGIIKVGLTYYLFINEQAPATRATGLATSTDLINWTKDPANPTLTDGRYCVCPFKFGSYYYLIVSHYLGGAAPVSTLELYRDTAPTFYASSRVYLGSIKQGYGPGVSGSKYATAASGFGFDTPFILTDDITRSTFSASNGDIWMYYSGNDTSVHTNCFTQLAISSPLGAASAWPLQPLGVSEGGLYATGPITSTSDVQSGGNNGFWLTNPAAFLLWTGRSSISSPANGNIKMQNQAGNDFGLLQLGGTTSSFPALKKSGTGLASRLADDSADSTLTAATLIESTAHTPSSASDTGTTGQIAWDASFVYICTATNTWKRVAISTW